MAIANRASARSGQFGTSERRWQRLLFDVALLVLGLATLKRLFDTVTGYGVPAWFGEELPPLLGLLVRGEPITQIDPRQYGVVMFLVFDPAVRAFGNDPGALQRYALVISLVALVLAWLVVARRFFASSWRAQAVLGLVWFNFTPLLYVLAQRMVDAWQLLFLSISLALFTTVGRQRLAAGVPLAAAALTKLLPGFVLGFVFFRDWRAGLLGIAAGLGLLGIGQVLYGTLMGFGYPFALLGRGGDTVAAWSTHFENNSLRGLVFKLAGGFRLEPTTMKSALSPDWYPPLNALVWLLTALLVGHLLFAAWRGRRVDGPNRRAVEFSLAIMVMLLISPHTAQDYMVAVLPVLAVFGFLWWRQVPRAWPPLAVVGAVVATLLVGVLAPMSVVARIIPFDLLLRLSGNAANPVIQDQVRTGLGAYQFFGFSGVGLILAWLVAAWLERQTARAPATSS